MDHMLANIVSMPTRGEALSLTDPRGHSIVEVSSGPMEKK